MEKLLKLVDMNEADITSKEKPIIGTQALATCFGILLYDEESKEAIVAHVSTDVVPVILKIFDLIKVNKKRVFKYAIIPGYYSQNEDPYDIKNKIKYIFEDAQTDDIKFEPFKNIPKDAVKKDFSTPSFEFAFDSRIGKFVSQEVEFDTNYNSVNKKSK